MTRGTRRAGLTAALAGLVVTLPVVPAVADEPYENFPQDAVVTIRGDGSGHGIGMSQYGAYRAARDGVAYRRILRTYYPGTEVAPLGGKIRVLVSADDDRSLTIDAVRGLRIATQRPRSSTRPSVAGVRQWRVSRRGGRNVISFRRNGWKVWKKVRGDVTFSAGRRTLRLRTPDGPVDYRGSLRSTRFQKQRITVNTLPMEHYLRGVVPAEMQAGWPRHALRAQAVAARTYAGYQREALAFRPYVICDTAACQAYGGASAEAPATTAAVRDTAKQVLTYDGETAFAMYSASNGGHTVEGPAFADAYLRARPDPYEGTSPDYYGWTVKVPVSDMLAEYNYDELQAIGIEERDGNGSYGGRVETVRVTAGSGYTDTITGEDFRRDWGLKSTLFRITSVR